MPKFHVNLSATAIVETTITVRADSPEDAQSEALKRLNEVLWRYMGLNAEPVQVVDVLEDR